MKSLTGHIIAEACDSMFYDGRKEVVEKYGLTPFIDLSEVGADVKEEIEVKIPKDMANHIKKQPWFEL